MRVDRDQLVSVVYDTFLQEYIQRDPSALDIFAVVWAAIEPTLLTTPVGRRRGAKTGLRFDDEPTVASSTLALMAVASALLESTNDGRTLPEQGRIERAFRSAARAFELPKEIENRLATSGAAAALRLYASLWNREAAPESEIGEQEEWVVKRLRS